MSAASAFASAVMRHQTAVFAASAAAGFGITLMTGRPAHEVLARGAFSRSLRHASRRRLARKARVGGAPARARGRPVMVSRPRPLTACRRAGAAPPPGEQLAYSFRLHSGPPMSS